MGLMRTVVCGEFTRQTFLSYPVSYSLGRLCNLFSNFSDISKRSAKDGGIEKTISSFCFSLCLDGWGREWKLVAETETFLISLAMKNCGSDCEETCFIAWEWDAVQWPGF